MEVDLRRVARRLSVTVLLVLFGWIVPAVAGGAGGSNESQETKLRNTLRWTTASEVDNFGFDVFRAKREEGPFHRVNDDPIPGAGTSDVPSDYVWVDSTIEPGQEYFYYVESISMAGVRERVTPTFRAPPKGTGAEAEGDRPNKGTGQD